MENSTQYTPIVGIAALSATILLDGLTHRSLDHRIRAFLQDCDGHRSLARTQAARQDLLPGALQVSGYAVASCTPGEGARALYGSPASRIDALRMNENERKGGRPCAKFAHYWHKLLKYLTFVSNPS